MSREDLLEVLAALRRENREREQAMRLAGLSNPHTFGWDERALELGNPATMDAPTLVEWIQRQFETSEETAERHREERRLHRAWHEANPGGAIIAGCCLRMADWDEEWRP